MSSISHCKVANRIIRQYNLSKKWFTSVANCPSVYDGRSLWSIFPRMHSQAIIGDVTVREGFQHEEFFIPTETKKYYLENIIYAGCKHIEITNFGSSKAMPQFNDNEELMQFAKGGELEEKCKRQSINFKDIVFKCVAVREYAVDIALEFAQKGYGPDTIIMMQASDPIFQKINSGITIDEYWREAESSIKKCTEMGVNLCGATSTIWGSPVNPQYEFNMNKAVDIIQTWLDLGAWELEHADHSGTASADEVFAYFTQIRNIFDAKGVDISRHICHFHELKRGVGHANVLSALQAGIMHFEGALGGIGGQPTVWFEGRRVRSTGKSYYEDNDPRYVGVLCLEDLLVQIDEMGIKHTYDIDKIIGLGKDMEKSIGRRLRSDVIRNGRTKHKIGKNIPIKKISLDPVGKEFNE